MDSIDKSILMALDRNCRISYEQLSRQLGISANAVRKRITNLLETGVIVEFATLFTPAMTNSESLFIQIQTNGCEDPDELSESLGNHPSVLQVTRVASGIGGSYIIFAEYLDSLQMLDLNSFVRSVECVVDIDAHPLLTSRGGRIELKHIHLRVLRFLIDSPRMQVSEIARKAGMTARSARRALDEMLESEAIWFSARWDLAASGSTRFFARIEFNPKTGSHEEIEEWLRHEYPHAYWYSYVSATEPIIFANFVVDHIGDADNISRNLINAEFITSAIPLIVFPTKKYHRIGMTMLEEKLREAGF
ncbi:MAG: winged helix-turn-helix transcriptional regulator [Candidatus Thorarchaeota archaeon]|nr:winged helix-turn-helix transcriptional regulator [Candidatus Thorarchaeota archaeon]